MAENIITFVILLYVSIIMIAIGISQIKSKEPVGFYTCKKPPQKEQLSDMNAWNKKHRYMWVTYGLALIGTFAVCFLIEAETIASIILLCVIIGALPIMMLYHHHLKKKYCR